ncbi:23S rRNA (guanosine(2251)-2'-O)-methyltransferase RlmB [Treponema pectinovorum]|uniref:23S rRNA (guanosine(2251)-2'-O)-methyltransferase RlmB n=1 Tax=Treponema pectinovorum TaxID=164 RepID=UPI0011C7D43B|nr:23S rRNA (guanosine(2251)-2'-O)-methyltransferase RlmB [Treponema pectinovorum]
MAQIITGFHAIEEKLNYALENGTNEGFSIKLSKTGPRIKKILEVAKKSGIPVENTDSKTLDSLVKILPEVAREHRGIVLLTNEENTKAENAIDFDQWILQSKKEDSLQTVLILDSITDPHNVGAIIRSCDQFGVSLVVMPERHSSNNFSENEIIARSSAGANVYVPIAIVKNLVRAVKSLKDADFWVYGADAGGESVQKLKFPQKTAIVMGSEGSGISRLLKEECDSILSIPTCGKIDSLNVSVATGVLLYERYRQSL